MCKFFSFCSNGRGKYLYFDWERRKELLASNPDHLLPDSHSSIAEEFSACEDRLNKYEYNPIAGVFNVDQINNRDDHVAAEKWVRKLDFKRIVEPLIIKPIVHPFRDIRRVDVTPKEIELLKQWASVRASVMSSVGDSVRCSVGASVRDSVWASVGAYISSFFSVQYQHDFSSCVKLWEAGLVPSFDGKTYRLHGNEDARILHEWTP